MRVVVLYEDSNEQAEAENLAKVLVNLAPTLCTADVDKDGGVTMTHRAGTVQRRILVQSRPYVEVFRQEPVTNDIRTWGGQLTRTAQNGTREVANKTVWQDLPGLIAQLSDIYGVDPALVETLAAFAESAKAS